MRTFCYVVTAAGGNPTAIEVISQSRTRKQYTEAGRNLMELYGKLYKIEQTGSLVLTNKSKGMPHFEMSGGEFCGNAARAAALVLAELNGNLKPYFTMSGVTNPIEATVINSEVTCVFTNLPLKSCEVTTAKYAPLKKVIDLGGIVHVVTKENFPKTRALYEAKHQEIVEKLRLGNKPAVGVVWLSKKYGKLRIDPVVWVKEVKTFYYESSCGSGSIAAAVATGSTNVAILQPTGDDILVNINDGTVTLTSVMEVIHKINLYSA